MYVGGGRSEVRHRRATPLRDDFAGTDPIRRHSRSQFKSLGIEGDGSDRTLHGHLTIGDVTRPLKFDVEFGGVESFFDGTRHAGFEAVGEIRRKDFDLNFGPLSAMLGDVVKIELDLQFVEPSA